MNDSDPAAILRLTHPLTNVLSLPRVTPLIDALDGLLSDVESCRADSLRTLDVWGEYVHLRDALERLTLSLMSWAEYGTLDPATLRSSGITASDRRRLSRYLRSGSARIRDILTRSK